MRIPIQLIPQGRIPRDPALTFRMQRVPAAIAPTETAAVTPAPTAIGYRDNFDGTAGDDLSTHLPNLGGPYLPANDSGPMLVMLLDGLSNLLPPEEDAGPDPASAISGTLGDTYTFSVLFNPAILDAGARTFLDFGARIAATDTWLLEPTLEWKTGAWTLSAFVQNAAEDTLFAQDNDVTALVNTGVLNRLTVDVSPSGTIWKINGTVVTSDANVPDVSPDSVALENFAFDPTLSKILLDEVSLL